MADFHMSVDVLVMSELGAFLDTWYDFSMSNPELAWTPMLVSSPGLGKTSFVKQLADKKGVKVFNLILSQANPSEVAGMVMPDPDGSHRTHIYDPQWVHELHDGDILFLDEVLKAPQATLNSCLTMVQERRMASGTKLPKVAIIAAANHTKQALSYPPELKQRFQAIDLAWDVNLWCDYMNNKYPWLNKMALGQIARSITASADGHSWNEFTPRDAEKMILWYYKDESAISYIRRMYGGAVAGDLQQGFKMLSKRHVCKQREQIEEMLVTQFKKSVFVTSYYESTDREFVKGMEQRGWLKEDHEIYLMLANMQALDEMLDEVLY